MAFPKSSKPKVQRGISLPPDLYQRIQDDAERLGLRWNDVVERVLAKAFFVPGNGKNIPDIGKITPQPINLKEVPDDDD